MILWWSITVVSLAYMADSSTAAPPSENRREWWGIVIQALLAVTTLVVGTLFTWKQNAHNQDLTNQQQIAQRLLNASSQLNGGTAYTRTAAVHELGTIARDEATERTNVLDILSAFFAAGAPVPNGHGSCPAGDSSWVTAPSKKDVQAAFVLLLDLYQKELAQPADGSAARYRLVLSQVCLGGAPLAGRDLSGANLISSDFVGSDLTGTVLACADLTDSFLQDANVTRTSFAGAVMHGAVFRQTHANSVVMVRTDFRNADLSNAAFVYDDDSYRFTVNADFRGASHANVPDGTSDAALVRPPYGRATAKNSKAIPAGFGSGYQPYTALGRAPQC